jgi:hypothetical protein
MTQTDRGKLVRRLAELVLENADELAMIECRDNGKLLKEMRAQMRAMPDSYLYFAGMADKLQGDTIPVNKLDMLNFNLREPIGVVGMIIPWNSPLMMLTGTLAPCLAIGNTIVVKPSEHATASTLALAELVIEAGIPPESSTSSPATATTGDALTRHPGIAKYVFTGSTFTGRKIAGNAAENLVPCQMELGGKSPHVIFPMSTSTRPSTASSPASSPRRARPASPARAASSSSRSMTASSRRWSSAPGSRSAIPWSRTPISGRWRCRRSSPRSRAMSPPACGRAPGSRRRRASRRANWRAAGISSRR